jgi:hypothetical protein
MAFSHAAFLVVEEKVQSLELGIPVKRSLLETQG